MNPEVEDTEPARVAPALTEFFYLLARDHLPTGVIRGIITSHLQHEPGKERTYSDPDLELWATARADEILAIDRSGHGQVYR